MIGLIYCFTDDWVNVSTGSVSSTDIFRVAAKPFGVTDIIIVNETNAELPGGDGALVNHEVNTIEEGLELYPGVKRVFVECPVSLALDGVEGIEIADYTHPDEDVLYIFGSDMSKIPPELLSSGDVVYIDTDISMCEMNQKIREVLDSKGPVLCSVELKHGQYILKEP